MLHIAPPPSRTPLAGPLSRPAQLLGALPQPLWVVQPDRQLLFANASAQQLLGQGLVQSQMGRLNQMGQLDTRQLGDLLACTAQGHALRTGLWFTPSLATGWLHSTPLAVIIREAADWPEDSLLLTLHVDEPALSQAARIDALTRQCRLSAAERQVLLLLADGEPVEATARHLGVGLSTVRTHVRNLLSKTQAPSLMQLLRWTGSAQSRLH